MVTSLGMLGRFEDQISHRHESTCSQRAVIRGRTQVVTSPGMLGHFESNLSSPRKYLFATRSHTLSRYGSDFLWKARLKETTGER